MPSRAFLHAAVTSLVAAAAIVPALVAKQLTVEDWSQIRPLFTLVEKAASGQGPLLEAALPWQCHFLNAEAGNVFVPFTIDIRAAGFTSYPLGMYLRVVKRGAPAPAPGPRDALAQYPFEDATVFDRPDDGRVTRAFAAPPGQYDVYVGLAERTTPDHLVARTVVLKREVNIPDFGSGLAVSSVFVLDRSEIDPRNRRLNFEEQLDEPYAWWGTKLTPTFRSTFRRAEKLSVTFVVYNAADAGGNKPDVEVRYDVFQRTDGGESFFVKTKPEVFTAITLRPAFSLAAGDLIIAGQELPLSRFPDGRYRLAITVEDRASGRSLSRDVVFTVAGP